MYYCHIIIFLLSLIFSQCLSFSFGTFFSGLKYLTISRFIEQCDDRWVFQNLDGLEDDLNSLVFGQDLATEIIIDSLRAHSSKTYRKKPLVLNFHGWPGGGKSYVAQFIVKRWYKMGFKSKFVKQYKGLLDFPVHSEIYNYQKRLQSEIEESVKQCPKSMFVFDEAEKYPPHLLDGIKAYLDYNEHVNGYDFREAVFIFISNIGETVITNIALNKKENGIQRDQLKVEDFEQELKKSAYNEETGGFYRSDMIRHHLIDTVVPFLPLEIDHVRSCIWSEMAIQHVDPGMKEIILRDVLDRISFGPPGHEIYSIHGCKGISENVGKIFEREKKRSRRMNNEL